jgi:tetratricopeptide (TPR) repeat protein
MEVDMIARSLLILGSSVLVATAAHGQSVTIIGANADALTCYRAADSDLRRPDALGSCAAALQADLTNHDRMATFVNRGIIRFRQEDTTGAIADFDAALAIDPDQPDALINKGITMLAGGAEIGPSMALIDQGLSGGPQRPWVGYYGRGVAHELAGRDAQAYHDYRRAQELRPGWAPAEQALSRFSVRG